MNRNLAISLIAVAGLLLAGCAGNEPVASSSSAPTTPTPNNGSSQATTPTPTTNPQPAVSPYAVPSGDITLSGSGSTFVKPLVDAWALDYNKAYSNVHVGYSGGGSGKGRGDIRDNNVAFAGSDAPMSVAEKSAAPNVLQFPDTIGPVAAVYNVDGVADGLHLAGDTLGKIFSGDIKMWNDDAIKADNTAAVASTLPAATIGLVYRSDSSGTTFTVTDYLSKVSPSFANRITPSANSGPDWTRSTGTRVGGQAGNDGVGSTVAATKNSIGYVDLAYVYKLSLKAAQIKNANGEWQAPTTDGAAKAAAGFANSLPAPDGDWHAVSIVNAPGAGVYPISTFSYLLVQNSLSNSHLSAAQYGALKAWIWWDLHTGQVGYPDALGYAPLPDSVITIGEHALQMMQS